MRCRLLSEPARQIREAVDPVWAPLGETSACLCAAILMAAAHASKSCQFCSQSTAYYPRHQTVRADKTTGVDASWSSLVFCRSILSNCGRIFGRLLFSVRPCFSTLLTLVSHAQYSQISRPSPKINLRDFLSFDGMFTAGVYRRCVDVSFDDGKLLFSAATSRRGTS